MVLSPSQDLRVLAFGGLKQCLSYSRFTPRKRASRIKVEGSIVMKRILFILLAIAIISITACSSSKDNTIPPTPLLNVKYEKSLRQLWITQVGKSSHDQFLTLRPVKVGNIVFATSMDGWLAAINTTNGKRLWMINMREAPSSSLGAGQGILVTSAHDGHVLAFRQNNGQLLWRANVHDQVFAAPLIVGNKVLIKTLGGKILALATSNGKTMWTHQEEIPLVILRGSSAPLVAGNTVIAGFANGNVTALNLQDGSVLWQQQISEPKSGSMVQQMVDIDATPKRKGDTLYITSYQGALAALSLQSGKVQWQRKMSVYAGLTIGDNWIYVTDADSRIRAIQRKSGSVMWRQNQFLGRSCSAPVIIGHYLVVVDGQGFIHVLSRKNGEVLARNRLTTAPISAAPLINGNSIVVYDVNGYLAAYQLN